MPRGSSAPKLRNLRRRETFVHFLLRLSRRKLCPKPKSQFANPLCVFKMVAPLYNCYVPPKTAIKLCAPVQSQEDNLSKKRKREDDGGHRPRRKVLPKSSTDRSTLSQGGQVDGAMHDSRSKKTSRKHANILDKFERAVEHTDADPSALDQDSVTPGQEPLYASGPLRNLEPIPRPARQRRAEPTYHAEPAWLRMPQRVPSKSQKPFEDLGIEKDLVHILKKREYHIASAVQTAVIPLLHPRTTPVAVCVSAATGSGKTLAYALPIAGALRSRVVSKLRAVVVVPTRELVSQVREVFAMCASGTDLKVGTAVGTHSLKSEQEALVHKGWRWHPTAYQRLIAKLEAICADPAWRFKVEQDPEIQDAIEAPPEHVPHWASKLDILVCTPGRLVDHLKATRGFSLEDLDYLVIDEADKLLDQSFQEWADTINREIATAEESHHPPGMLPCDNLRRQRTVRKVLLSATMTKDLDRLAALRLDAPIRIDVGDVEDTAGLDKDSMAFAPRFSIPASLREHAVPVGDGSDKPLYLSVLLDRIFGKQPLFTARAASSRIAMPLTIDGEGDADREGRDSSISSSATSSAVSSDDDDDRDVDGSKSSSILSASPSSESEDETRDEDLRIPSSRQASEDFESPNHQAIGSVGHHISPSQKSCLVFTKSNESALRLSRLLLHLAPAYQGRLSTITRGARESQRRQVMSKFRSGQLDVVIASERAARGLDLVGLTDVVSYDTPGGVESYIHRIGRTARAGKPGTAWTLLEHSQARWFWKEIGGSEGGINRGSRGVERTRVAGSGSWSEQAVHAYRRALAQLQQEVTNQGR